MKAILKVLGGLWALPIMIMASNPDDINQIKTSGIYSAPWPTTPQNRAGISKPLEPEVLWHNVRRDAQGIFQLQFDRQLFQDQARIFFLKYDDQAIAKLNYEQGHLDFVGAERQSFTFKAAATHPESTMMLTPQVWLRSQQNLDIWPACHIAVSENLTLHNGIFGGEVQLQAKHVELFGQTLVPASLTVKAQENCQLANILWANKFTLNAPNITQQLNSQIQTEQDIALEDFQDFRQMGQLRAKRSVLISDKAVHRTPEAYSFAGALYLARVSNYHDQGQTTAWKCQLKADQILFDNTYFFHGHYLFAKAGLDKTKPALLTTNLGSKIRAGFASHLYSANRLIHHGDIAVSSSLAYSFPSWEYSWGPRSKSQFHSGRQSNSELTQLNQQMAKARQHLKSQLPETTGLVLEAGGSLEQSGKLKTAVTSIRLQAPQIDFSGDNEAGVSDNNKMFIKANQAVYRGQLQAPGGGIHFDVAEKLELGGHVEAKRLQVFVPHITLTGRTQTSYLELETTNLRVANKSVNTAQKLISMIVTDRFHNQGQLSSQGDIILQDVQNYQLGNLKAEGSFHFSPIHLPSITELYRHPDPAFTGHGGLNLVSSAPQVLDQPLNLPFGIGLKAPSIHIKSPLTSAAHLYFESTQGPIIIEAPLTGQNLDLTSAEDLTLKGLITLSQSSRCRAQGRFDNYQQLLALCGQIDVTAASIHNRDTTSKIIAQVVSLEATQGAIENKGRLQGYRYLEGRAAGDISSIGLKDQANKTFIPACIIGGEGLPYIDTKQQSRLLGLHLRAEGKIINNISYLVALLDIMLSGKQGICHGGDSLHYLAYEDEDEGFLGFNSEQVKVWKDLAVMAKLESARGRITSQSRRGDVEYKATRVYAPEGEYLEARGDIKYRALIVETIKEQEKSSWWGLQEDSAKETHQDAVVTQLLSSKIIEHISIEGGIHGQAPYIQTQLYRLRSRQPAIFVGVKLRHHHEITHSSCLPVFAGSALLKGTSLSDTLIAADPLLCQINGFLNSRDPASRWALGVKSGVQGFNDYRQLGQAYQSGQMAPALIDRFNIANVGIEINHSSYTHDYTTTKSAVMKVGTADFGDVPEIKLFDGATVLAEDKVILPPRATVGKATDSSFEVAASSLTSGGFNAVTGMPFFSHSQHNSGTQQQRHRNAVLITDVLDASRTQQLDLYGANIVASRAIGDIDHVNMISYPDTSSSSHSGWGFGISNTAGSLQGSVSVSGGQAQCRQVNQHSGIDIDDPTGFNSKALAVTDTALNPNLHKLSDNITFRRLYDTNTSHCYKMGLSNLDLRSGQGFGNSLGQGIAQIGRGIGAAYLAQQAGWGDVGASAVATMAGMGISDAGNPQALSVGGEFAYQHNGQSIDVPLINIHPQLLPDDWQHQPQLQDLPRIIDDVYYQQRQAGMSDEEALQELYDPGVNKIIQQIASLDHDLADVTQKAAAKSKGKQQLSPQQARPGKDGDNTSTNRVDSSSAGDASAYVRSLGLNNRTDPEQVIINQAVIQAQLEFLNNYESELRRASQDNNWSTIVGHYVDAALETVIEIKNDIANNPWQYGAMAAECIPFGIGAIATIGNKGYEVYDTDKTIWRGTGELAAEAGIGYVGGKLVYGILKSGKLIYKTIAAKVHKAKLDKACNMTGVKLGKQQAINIDPKNRAAHEKHKDIYREEMGRPHANDPKLREILEYLHKTETNCVGSGSTAAAVREEMRTSLPVGGKFHTQKAQDGIVMLEKWLRNNKNATTVDKVAAENMLKDLKNVFGL